MQRVPKAILSWIVNVQCDPLGAITSVFGISDAEADRILNKLISDGYIVKKNNNYYPTEKGEAFIYAGGIH